MTARAGLAVAVMMALAVGHIKAGRPEKMRHQNPKKRYSANPSVSGCYARAG